MIPKKAVFAPAAGVDIGNKSEDFNAQNGFADGKGDPWASVTHDTHQDPSGAACRQLANAFEDYFDAAECYEQLTVASHRGFCAPSGYPLCNSLQPDYQDACELLNEPAGSSAASRRRRRRRRRRFFDRRLEFAESELAEISRSDEPR